MKWRIISFGLFLCASGCGSEYPSPGANATATSIEVTRGTVSIASEDFTADYGSIVVPENRSVAGCRLIIVPFLRIHAKSKSSVEPIFALTGGPGNSNLTWDLKFALQMLHDRDIVLVGYRGVDGSSVLDCPEVVNALKEGDPLSEESMANIGNAWVAAANRLTSEGVDLNGYNILECIEDFESVRNALGYPRINLISKSYGTRVAYLYGLIHPERIFRSAMISVNPPGRFVWDRNMIDSQLRYYASLWAKDSLMLAKSPDLYQTMTRVLNNMPREWLGIPITEGKVKIAAFSLLYHRKTAAQVFNAFVAADHGDASGLAMMSVAYDLIVPSLMVWGDAYKAVGADFDSTRNHRITNDPTTSAPLGSPLGKLLWGPIDYGRWPVNQLPMEFRTPQPSEVETLLLSGNIDFSTPAEYATVELLPYLRNGRQFIISECGHTSDMLNPDVGNVAPMLKIFYDTGTVDASMNKYLPMNFEVGVGFPVMAKIIICVIALFVVTITVILYRIARRIKRKSLRAGKR